MIVLFRSVIYGVPAKTQKVLQFQSLGTLAAISARWGIRGVAMPGTGAAVMGLEPEVSYSLLLMDEVSLDEELLARLRQERTSLKQRKQARLVVPLGLKLASWSRGISKAECESQKMFPQRRQWWRRVQ